MVFNTNGNQVFIRSLTYSFLLLACFLVYTSVYASDLKQLTVNDYLTKAKLQGLEPNNLVYESSPYLLQHAYNPVKWYPWGDEAFKKAKDENKPIFLSIGYSTCHWCHVMAHESFENKKIAALLNKNFVSIKVDREQRPDIDSIYMSATELINGQGGWPMTVFLDHALRPFHAAVYYPPFSNDERQGFYDVLLKLHELWVSKPSVINEVAKKVTERIKNEADSTVKNGELSGDIYKRTMLNITERFDEEMGGFSDAPKFPSPGIFSFLTQIANNEKNHVKDKVDSSLADNAKKMMEVTLNSIIAGGIYDRVAGGFHRYSVDANWQVPHFEKMLYSQALMLNAISDFYRIRFSVSAGKEHALKHNQEQTLADKQRYKEVIYQTLAFLKQEMKSPDGGYYSALDADSEQLDNRGRKTGKRTEGAYYLWSEAELKNLLEKDEFLFVKQYFDINEEGNIFSDPYGEFIGLNIIYIDEDFRDQNLTKEQKHLLLSVREKLSIKRLLRPRPHLDDKVITAWNAMLVSSYAKLSTVFNDESLLNEAIHVLDYVKSYLYDVGRKKLYRQHRNSYTQQVFDKLPTKHINNRDSNRIEAVLVDYVWLIDALLYVYEASKDKQWLEWAVTLQKTQDDIFLDEVSGAYYASANNDTNLLFRSKSIFDDVIPASNAIALSNLRRFSLLLKEYKNRKLYSNRADKMVSSFSSAVNENPVAAAMFLSVELQH